MGDEGIAPTHRAGSGEPEETAASASIAQRQARCLHLPVNLTPGTYTFTVSDPDSEQAPTVQLTAGAQVYYNVDAEDWVGAGNMEQDRSRGVFDLRQISAPLADAYFPTLTGPSRD
jgi:hypothetical protein